MLIGFTAASAFSLLEEACIFARAGQAGSEAMLPRECEQLAHLFGRWVHLKPPLQVVSLYLWEEVVCAKSLMAHTGGREHFFHGVQRPGSFDTGCLD